MKCMNQGSRIDREYQFPVKISVIGKVNGKDIEWSRSLNKSTGRTSTTEVKEIIAYAMEVQEKVKSGNKDILSPIIAYYGIGRLWMTKREKNNQKIFLV